ncbi:MAG: PEP-CTERM sorting domain-containing protein [Pirellulaceae bacterium]
MIRLPTNFLITAMAYCLSTPLLAATFDVVTIVDDLLIGADHSSGNIASVGDLLFIPGDSDRGFELHWTDGQTASGIDFNQDRYSFPQNLRNEDNHLYLWANLGDIPALQPTQFRFDNGQFLPVTRDQFQYYPNAPELDGWRYFTRTDDANQNRLVRINEDDVVENLNVVPDGSLYGPVGGQILIVEDLGSDGYRLRSTNGQQVVELAMFDSSIFPIIPHSYTQMDDYFLFSATGPSGNELYVTDGHDVMEMDLNDGIVRDKPLSSWPNLQGAIEQNGILYFAGNTQSGLELFATDGTSFQQLTFDDFSPKSSQFRSVNGTIVAPGDTETLLVDNRGITSSSIQANEVLQLGDQLFMSGRQDGVSGLFRTNGEEITSVDTKLETGVYSKLHGFQQDLVFEFRGETTSGVYHLTEDGTERISDGYISLHSGEYANTFFMNQYGTTQVWDGQQTTALDLGEAGYSGFYEHNGDLFVFVTTRSAAEKRRSLLRITRTDVPLGDLDYSQSLEVADVDILISKLQVGSHYHNYDLNADEQVDSQDLDLWVHDLAKTYYGDANLDGQFDSTDLVQIFTFGSYENRSADATWSTGDWNADGFFGSADLVLAFQDGGYDAGPRADRTAAVPEPSTLIMFLAASTAMFWQRQRT